jgi:chlorite dismutase
MTQQRERVAQPPETLEGWYALHQIFRIDRERVGALGGATSPVFEPRPGCESGWSEAVALIGSTADVLFVHFRPTLDDILVAQRDLAREPWMRALVPTDAFLSVTEAGLYALTAKLAKETAERGGAVGDEAYEATLRERVMAERENPHVRKRLYPERPAGMPYVSFYPMTKRRESGQNWYELPMAERSRMMWEHGLTGRRYAGRVLQIITGAIGFDAWEWGVTLFASDPLDFKKLVTEMRFDEASARYAEFGRFYTGRAGTLAEVLGG